MRMAHRLGVLAFVFLAAPCAAVHAQIASLRVDMARPGARVDPRLYGVFFEEINHAGDGGLFAELVRNGSLEDAETPQGWTAAPAGRAGVEIAIETRGLLNVRQRRCLRVSVGQAGQGAANEGYWGIAVRRGEAYRLSLYARSDTGADLRGELVSAAGKPLGSVRLGGVGASWKRLGGTLRAEGSDPAASLVLRLQRPGTAFIDLASLMPVRTFRGRADGLRADLAGRLEALRPAFVRFPGGCFVEGDRLANAFRWKTTIGERAWRTPHRNLWGYVSSNGLGYHEYLQMCEDLRAEPLFVINCGMAHSDNAPMAEMEAWVRDALDAIEYANGPVDSRWGAERARNGHPKPFGLRMVEIGNENGGAAYEERYALFHDAIKARYPDVQLVANVPVTSRPMDILDEHYYNSPRWFAANASRYDSYDRGGPRIYVGEYAVTQECGQGNLRAAVAEAAFMTGIERNADIVTMASYAPLLVNVRNRAWNPDLIGFDGESSYGTPSYYVQQLFSLNRPDRNVAVSVDAPLEATPTGGAVGLGTWATQAEFADVRVERDGATLLEAAFRDGAPGWRPLRGAWQAADGVYRQASEEVDCRATAGDPTWDHYDYRLRARKLGGAEGFLILFRVRDDSNWYWWNLGGWGNRWHAVEQSVGGSKTLATAQVPGRIETGRWYEIRVDVDGARVRCYLDGRLVHSFEDSGLRSLHAAAGAMDRSRELVVKVANTSNVARETDVMVAGVKVGPLSGTATVLTADSPDAENSLADPTRVAPVTRRVRFERPAFRYRFPAHSLTVLRLKRER